jgi:hypothetical protein
MRFTPRAETGREGLSLFPFGSASAPWASKFSTRGSRRGWCDPTEVAVKGVADGVKLLAGFRGRLRCPPAKSQPVLNLVEEVRTDLALVGEENLLAGRPFVGHSLEQAGVVSSQLASSDQVRQCVRAIHAALRRASNGIWSRTARRVRCRQSLASSVNSAIVDPQPAARSTDCHRRVRPRFKDSLSGMDTSSKEHRRPLHYALLFRLGFTLSRHKMIKYSDV